MACHPIRTGESFLSASLANIDCQGRTIGSYGYGVLSDPSSSASIALTSLMTVFVALLGIRLLMNRSYSGRDVISDILRVGVVLTLASSWPAWRTVGYDLVMDGPPEVARSIGLASGLPGSRNDQLARLQDADDAIVLMTVYGSGRMTGGVAAGSDLGDTPQGIAVADQFALGIGRTTFLASTIGSFAIVRLGAGLLLAIAPLMAGLLLFSSTTALFSGWLRGLVFCTLASLFLSVIQGVQLALMFPWLSNVLAVRGANTFTYSAPTEFLVLTLAFAAVTIGMLFLAARLTFLPATASLNTVTRDDRRNSERTEPSLGVSRSSAESEMPSRAHVISGAVAEVLRREERGGSVWRIPGAGSSAAISSDAPRAASGSTVSPSAQALGGTFRRNYRRTSGAAQKRDLTK